MIELTSASALLKKLSNNLVGANNETIFTLPLQEIPLERQQLDELMGARTFESFYNLDKDVWRPMDWIVKAGVVPIPGKFDSDRVIITSADGVDLTFDPRKDADGDDVPAGKISQGELTATVGGITMLAFHIQVYPGRGKKNAELQNSQERRIQITLADMRAVGEKPKPDDSQRELGLGHQNGDQEKRDAALAAAGNNSSKPIDGTTPASRARSSRSSAH